MVDTLTPEAVVQFSLEQCHAEAASRWQKAAAINAKYPNGLTLDDSADDYNMRRQLESEIDLIESRASRLEDAAQWTQRVMDAPKRYGRSVAGGHPQPEGEPSTAPLEMFGKQFINDPQYKQLRESGVWNNPASLTPFSVQLKGSMLQYLVTKALIYTGSGVGGPLIVNDRAPTVELAQRELTVLDIIPNTSTTSGTIEYAEETAWINGAAEVAEATATTGTSGQKPESTLQYTLRTVPVATIAHWIPVTNAMLADAPAIDGMIRNRLLLGLNIRLEQQVISGDGNSPNIRGIINTPGVLSMGVNGAVSLGGAATVIDAAYAAMNAVMVTGLAQPSATVIHPNDWAAVRLARENSASGTLGGYLYGSPALAGPVTMWGRAVVVSTGISENTMLVGDFNQGCMLFDREQGAIRVGTINDQFTRNMQTILAELRAAFAVFRPTAFCKVTGV